MPARILNLLTRACIAGIILGIIAMIQPWVFVLFKDGFLLLLASTLLYIVVSHLPERASAGAGPAANEDRPPARSAAESPKP